VVSEEQPRYAVRDHGLLRFGVWDTKEWAWVEIWGDDSFPTAEGIAEHRAEALNVGARMTREPGR
jgi:hypothetical protein